jgi:DNA helicase-2/ATP-dependent DNA helicase PcrA
MFYVAMTRAKDRLHIFYVKERYHKRQTVSRFVVETGLLGKKGDLEKNGKQGRK